MGKFFGGMEKERGKNIFRGIGMNGRWYYGSLIHTTMGNTKTWISWSARGNGGWFNLISRAYVKPKTVGQFTGRFDKNDVPVFEGDIVKGKSYRGHEFVGVVGFRDCSFIIKNDIASYYCWTDYEVEVIGNIHQNPELMEM